MGQLAGRWSVEQLVGQVAPLATVLMALLLVGQVGCSILAAVGLSFPAGVDSVASSPWLWAVVYQEEGLSVLRHVWLPFPATAGGPRSLYRDG